MKLILILLPLLTGCVGDHKDTQSAPQNLNDPASAPRTISIPVSQVPANGDERGYFAEVKSELQQSNNATQNSITGLGVQVTKLGEKVDVSAVKMENRVNTSLSNEMKAQAELTAQLRADVRTEVKASANLMAKLESRVDAKLHAQVQALAGAIAGIGNKIESVAQTYSSGRDTNTTQFTDKMADTLISSQRQPMYIVLGIAAILLIVQEAARRRSAQREKAAKEHGK